MYFKYQYFSNEKNKFIIDMESRLDVALVEADICAGQSLHLALKLQSAVSGTSENNK